MAVPFTTLPDELILLVLRALPAKSIRALSHVSRRLWRLANDPLCLEALVLPADISRCRRGGEDVSVLEHQDNILGQMQWFARCAVGLRHLKVGYWTANGTPDPNPPKELVEFSRHGSIIRIMRTCVNLRSFWVEGGVGYEAKIAFHHLEAQTYPKLTHVHVSRVSLASPSGVWRKQPQLTHLTLYNVSLTGSAADLPVGLRSVRLIDCPLAPGDIAALGRRCPGLEALTLRKIHKWGRAWPPLGVGIVGEVKSHCCALRELELGDEIPDVAFEALSEAEWASNLRAYDVKLLVPLTGRAVHFDALFPGAPAPILNSTVAPPTQGVHAIHVHLVARPEVM